MESPPLSRSPSPMPIRERSQEDEASSELKVDNDPTPYVAFSLEPRKLKSHLETPVCNPNPSQIVTQLALRSEKQSGNVELENSSQLKFKTSEVNLKLKRSFRTNALRVFAFDAWNLSLYDKTVPLHLVNLLLNELILITDEHLLRSPDDEVLKSLSITAKVFYHYWCLEVFLKSRKLTKSPAMPNNIQPNMLNDPRLQYSEQLNATLKMMSDKCELNANQVDLFVNNKDYSVEEYYLHSCDTLHQLTTEGRSQLYSFNAKHVLACVNFAVGKLKFSKLEMSQAKARFEFVCSLMSAYEANPLCEVFKINPKELSGFCIALGITQDQNLKPLLSTEETPSEKLERLCNGDNYRAIVDMLLEDNLLPRSEQNKVLNWSLRLRVAKEIPENCQFKFQANVCNVVNSFLKSKHRSPDCKQMEIASFLDSLQWNSQTEIAFLLMVVNKSMDNYMLDGKLESENARKMFAFLITQILIHADVKIAMKILKDRQPPICDALTSEEIKSLSASLPCLATADVDDLESSLENPVKSLDSSLLIPGNLVIKRMVVLENEIIMEASIEKTRELLNEYIQMPNARPIIVHFETWIPKIWLDRIKSITTPDSYYRSFVPLALGKGFRFLALGEYRVSHDWFLTVAQLTNQVLGVLPGQTQSMSTAFEWEAMNARLSDLINSDQKLTEDLVQKCLATLFNYLGNGSLFDIRSEIVETCVISLLNSGCYKHLTDFSKFTLKIVKVGAILSRFKLQMINQGVPKFDGCKELFAMVLEFHTTSEDDSKRPRMIQPPDVSVEKPTSIRDNFQMFCTKLNDTFIIDCLLACLVRLYNVLNSENLVIELTSAQLCEGGGIWRQLFVEHENLPNVSKTVSSIQRTLNQLLSHLLYRKTGISNSSWVKTYVELQIAQESYLTALQVCLRHGSKISSSFSVNNLSNSASWKRIWSDELINLMIRCCEKLTFNVTAALFAQMMVTPSYNKVFSLLGSDAPRISRDAGDELYKFIHDKVILECIINAHTSRGEIEKAQIAMEQIKKVDLNDYNSSVVKNTVAQTYSYNACQHVAKLLL